MQDAFKMITKVLDNDITVLTSEAERKELVARAILITHQENVVHSC
jgi:hypothetical protein